MSGTDLLSHTANRAVPSALEGFTIEFEMGSGVAPPQKAPDKSISLHSRDSNFKCIFKL